MFSAAIKGWYGELCGNFAQSLFLDSNIYHALNNTTIPTQDGGTTQIDHIIVSQYGIFVIEAKFMDGWIFGSQHKKEWTQCFPRKKFKFQNPLRQNYRHTKALSEFLKLDHGNFHSIVMFWGDSTFKTPMPKNVMDKGYSDYIKSKDDLLFTESQVQQILVAIQAGALPRSWKTHFQHVNHLKQKHAASASPSNDSKTAKQSCPRCNGTLVPRIAKRGPNKGQKFFGCSNFPKCRQIVNHKKCGEQC